MQGAGRMMELSCAQMPRGGDLSARMDGGGLAASTRPCLRLGPSARSLSTRAQDQPRKWSSRASTREMISCSMRACWCKTCGSGRRAARGTFCCGLFTLAELVSRVQGVLARRRASRGDGAPASSP